MDGHEIPFPEERMKLERIELLHPSLAAEEGVRDDEDDGPELFDLRALSEVEAILDGKGVEVEATPEAPHGARSFDASLDAP